MALSEDGVGWGGTVFFPAPRDHQDGGWWMITYFTWFLQHRETPPSPQFRPKMLLIMAFVGNELVPSS